MYKTKLQELCQRRRWTLPDYETVREGPDQNPRFSSTVTVDGNPFRSSSPARSAKLAQNAAAMVAFNHFSQPPPGPYKPITPSIPNLTSFPQPSLCAPSSPPPSGSPGSSIAVDSILPINRALQPKLEGCLTSQTSFPVTVFRDTMTERDQQSMLHLYKNQLQSYAQKRNLNLPVYSSEWEGPPHALRFKCKVTIDGQTYESSKFYYTLKDAEHAAAEVALMSLSLGGVQEDHAVIYKNLLQELVQKKGFHLPIYTTTKSGEAHMPIFVSQVEVAGEYFTGQETKSKKQAEMSAAKVAYTTLKECKDQNLFPQSAHQGEAPEFSPDCSEINVTMDLQHPPNPKSPVSTGLVIRNQPNKDKGKSDQSSSFPLTAHQGQLPEFSSNHSGPSVITDLQQNSIPKLFVSDGLVSQNQPDKDKLKKTSSSSGNTNGCADDFSSSNGKPAPSVSDSTNVNSETTNLSSTAVSTPSDSLSSTAVSAPLFMKKFICYSRKTNVKIENGGTLKPYSDHKWVAYLYS